MTMKRNKTFWKFLIVGVFNTLFGTTIMFVAYNLFHLNYWISSACNYILGSVLSYFLNKYFTFQHKNKSFLEVLKFIVNISACYLAAYGIAKPIISKLFSVVSISLQENISMLVGMGIFVVLNYFGQKFFVFKRNISSEE